MSIATFIIELPTTMETVRIGLQHGSSDDKEKHLEVLYSTTLWMNQAQGTSSDNWVIVLSNNVHVSTK